MYWNTITELKRMQVKPLHYVAVRADDGKGYNLLFTFVHPKTKQDYAWLQTARGEIKRYATIDAMTKEVYTIDPTAVISIEPCHCTDYLGF